MDLTWVGLLFSITDEQEYACTLKRNKVLKMFGNILFDLTTGKYLSTSTYIQSFVGRVDDIFNSIVEEHS